MDNNSGTSSENFLSLFQLDTIYSKFMTNNNNQLDYLLPDGTIKITQDRCIQTDVHALTAEYLPVLTFIPPNESNSTTNTRLVNGFSKHPFIDTDTRTTGLPVVNEPPPPLPPTPPLLPSSSLPPSPPLLPALPTPSFTTIKPSIKPFAIMTEAKEDAEIEEITFVSIETQTEDSGDSSSTATTGEPKRKRRKPNVTGGDLYRGGQLVQDTIYQATNREIREYYKLINKRVVCCIDRKSVQKISCFRYKNEQNQYICYNCAKNVNRDDLSDWSKGIDFTGEVLYQCNRLSHARPIWYFINQVKENNMCTLYKICIYCQMFIKYSKK